MLVLITYDVSTSSDGGEKRLRNVAKACERVGQRVQNSVFECVIDNSEYVLLKNKLEKLIDKKRDSLRFYNLGKKYHTKIVHIGAKETYDIDGELIV